jgi:murein L,D-transpeptidase YafK
MAAPDQHLMVHGACSSAGCYSMTDGRLNRSMRFARDAFKPADRPEFQIQAFRSA